MKAWPKAEYKNYKLLAVSANHFKVIDGKGDDVGTLYQQGPVVTTDINNVKLDFRRKGTRDEHALAYGILFIIIVLSVAIYYTKF